MFDRWSLSLCGTEAWHRIASIPTVSLFVASLLSELRPLLHQRVALSLFLGWLLEQDARTRAAAAEDEKAYATSKVP